MKIFIRVIMLCLSFFVLSGCTLTNDTIALNHQPTRVSPNALMAATQAPIQVKTFIDQRDGDPKLIVHKMNMYHIRTSGGFYADQPIATIVQDAITNGLQNIGYKTTDIKGDYTLGGFVNNVNYGLRVGLVEGTVRIILTTTLNLTDKNGQLLWSKTFESQGTEETAVLNDASIRIAFNKTLDNLVQQLQASPTFKAALRK